MRKGEQAAKEEIIEEYYYGPAFIVLECKKTGNYVFSDRNYLK
jgi:hypothetical protein